MSHKNHAAIAAKSHHHNKLYDLASNTTVFWVSSVTILCAFLLTILVLPKPEDRADLYHFNPCTISKKQLIASGYRPTPKKEIHEDIFAKNKIFSTQMREIMRNVDSAKKHEHTCMWGSGGQRLWITTLHWRNSNGPREFLHLSQMLIEPDSAFPNVHRTGLAATILHSLVAAATEASSYSMRGHQVFFIHLDGRSVFDARMRHLELCIANITPGMIIRTHGYSCDHVHELLDIIL